MSKRAVPLGFTPNSNPELLVGVFGFDLQLLLAGLTNPSMFAVDEGMVVDALAIILRAKITRHGVPAPLSNPVPYSAFMPLEIFSSVSLSGI